VSRVIIYSFGLHIYYLLMIWSRLWVAAAWCYTFRRWEMGDLRRWEMGDGDKR